MPRRFFALLAFLFACAEPPLEGRMTSSSSGEGGVGGVGAASGVGGSCEGMAGAGGAMMPYPISIGGQDAWVHDEGFSSGSFHTFDALLVAGPDDTPRKVHVFLPRGYTSGCKRYPVVYMNDGNTTFWPGGLGNKTWNVAGGLEALYAENAIEEVIVVAIHPVDRELEYTHTDWYPGHACCGVEQYTNYVADAVKGFIDANYPTRPGPEDTAIVGSSHGGLAAFYMASRRPDRFGKAGCLSSSFWAGLDPVHGGSYSGGPLSSSLLIDGAKASLSDPSKRPRLWIDWGLVRTGGTHNSAIEEAATVRGKEMVALLEGTYGYGVNSELFWYEDPLGEHDEDSWARRFPMVMKALFAGTGSP